MKARNIEPLRDAKLRILLAPLAALQQQTSVSTNGVTKQERGVRKGALQKLPANCISRLELTPMLHRL